MGKSQKERLLEAFADLHSDYAEILERFTEIYGRLEEEMENEKKHFAAQRRKTYPRIFAIGTVIYFPILAVKHIAGVPP